jgi:hypothetical protein
MYLRQVNLFVLLKQTIKTFISNFLERAVFLLNETATMTNSDDVTLSGANSIEPVGSLSWWQLFCLVISSLRIIAVLSLSDVVRIN